MIERLAQHAARDVEGFDVRQVLLLERGPGEFIVDPWVAERATLVAWRRLEQGDA